MRPLTEEIAADHAGKADADQGTKARDQPFAQGGSGQDRGKQAEPAGSRLMGFWMLHDETSFREGLSLDERRDAG
ncbi:hypothetical protein Rhsp01_39570 [Rhizobium sp. NBRC 114257]|uniref:Uncharacterized protein n=1 Tax=Rhizobium dioscoreae TaxID=2653122 RepID=A0ABQ0Z748_9HYPH|nr:hypothetical protein RsS93_39430 [Rhizobium dioscoreae]GLU82781.1 hypothetical protein Rhsp01_39570 [Rhizobium sp. NBRC 114257]